MKSGWYGYSGWPGWSKHEIKHPYAFNFLPVIKLQKFGPKSYYIEIGWFFWTKYIYF